MPLRDEHDRQERPEPEVLWARIAHTGFVRRLLEIARDEDLGPAGAMGDVTTLATIDAGAICRARVVLREAGVVAGLAAGPDLLTAFAPGAILEPHVRDGQPAEAGATLATLTGPTRQVLALERTLLNLLGRLSGIATRTAAFVRAMGPDPRAHLYHTRKTTPGLRHLEVYAARCGGASLHRLGLHEGVLIKDNHLAALAGEALGQALRARLADICQGRDLVFVEVEVDSLVQLREVLALPRGMVDIVLLDNMRPDQLREGAGVRDRVAPAVRLEASGGITLETIAEIAQTGVDRISVGSITHGARALDVGLDFGE